ncbi:hypothetical protein LJY25_02720 [Hymenobacter sp. BT175]|uniref:contractile injection system tape measure protein n=1 Tax=Hymenobacter translucens TaxID=2886507 RepID=UPI001D0EDF1C|nr:contractile injection system tape measure protein [Hymenobacter translucens]MCC2545344.1 hypothetical protein [Hymenobacter translucens]
MNRATHAIQELRLDIVADDAPGARLLPDRISTLCRTRLIQVVEEELTRFCPSDAWVALASVVLDMGLISQREVETELPDRLRRRLREALEQLPRPAADVKQDASLRPAVLDVLEYYLLHGSLPWQVDATTFSLSAVLQEALTRHAGDFRALVLRRGSLDYVRRRLVEQLSQGQLQRLIALLEPAHADFILEYLLAVETAHPRLLVPVSQVVLRRVVYELVLTDLLTRTGSAFNRRSFIGHQIRRLAVFFNLDYEVLLRRLFELAASTLPFPAQSALPAIIRTVYLEEAKHGQSGGSEEIQAGLGATGRSDGSLRQNGSLTAVAGRHGPPGSVQVLDVVRPAGVRAAGTASAVSPVGPVAEEYLLYFLRHGTLPAAVSGVVSRAQVQRALTELSERNGHLLALVQRAGGFAAATLARYAPGPVLHQLLRQAAPGQVRAVLAAMTAWQATETSRRLIFRPNQQVLWEPTLTFLLNTKSPRRSSQSLAQWLSQHLPASAPALMGSSMRAGGPTADRMRGIVREFLLHGWLPTGNILRESEDSGMTMSYLSRAIKQLVQQEPIVTRAFVRENLMAPGVQRNLVQVADLTLLAELLPGAHSIYKSGQRRREVLAELERQAAWGTGPTQWQLFLRAACIVAVLQPRPVQLAAMQQLAASHGLPWRAVLAKAQAWQQRLPPLAAEPFFARLLTASAQLPSSVSLGALWSGNGSKPNSPQVNTQPAHVKSAARRETTGSHADRGSAATGTRADVQAEAGAGQATKRNATAVKGKRNEFGWKAAAGSSTRSTVRPDAGSKGFAATDGAVEADFSALTGCDRDLPNHLSFLAAPHARWVLALTSRRSTGQARRSAPTPGGRSTAAGPFAHSKPAPDRAGENRRPPLSGPAHQHGITADHFAEGALVLLLHYLLEGRPPAWWRAPSLAFAHLHQLLRLIMERQQPALQRFLKRHAARARVGQRLAGLADFALLQQLTPNRSSRSRRAEPALTALDRHSGATGFQMPGQVLAFLRAGYLTFHQASGPAGSARTRTLIRQLAGAYGLPWRATLIKVARMVKQRPLLRADAFFASLVDEHDALARKTTAASKPAGNSASAKKSGTDLPAGVWGCAPGIVNPAHNHQKAKAYSRGSGGYLPAADDRQPMPAPVSTRLTKGGYGDENARDATLQASRAGRQAHREGVETAGGLPTGDAARDLVFYYLQHGQLPWWSPPGLQTAQLARLLAQVAHHYKSSTQLLVRELGTRPAFIRRLAALSDFTLISQLINKAGSGRSGPALRELDGLLTSSAVGSERSTALFLREAYLTFRLRAGAEKASWSGAEARRQAAGHGLPWRGVLGWVHRLQQQLPALATDPFFAWLLSAFAGEGQRQPYRPARVATHTPAKADGVVRSEALERSSWSGSMLPLSPPKLTVDQGIAGDLPASEALEHYLQTGELAVPVGQPAHPPAGAASFWEPLLRRGNGAALQQLRPCLAVPTMRERLLRTLSADHFFRLLRLLYPVQFRLLAGPVGDWQLLGRQGVVRLAAPVLFDVILKLVVAVPAASFRPVMLAQALLQAEVERWPSAPGGEATIGQRILREAQRRGLVLRSRLPALLTVVHEAYLAKQTAAGRKNREITPSDSRMQAVEEAPPLETVYIANAGLVLLWPFLTTLFDRLGYLQDAQFPEPAPAARAALLLQFLATGSEAAPEHALALNKLLCGIGQPQPLLAGLVLTDEEKSMGESLLKAVIGRWEILKNTSVAGLRETFLQRQGKMEWVEERVQLTVETKTLDILLDRRPWSISIIKLPWMALPLYVTWR